MQGGLWTSCLLYLPRHHFSLYLPTTDPFDYRLGHPTPWFDGLIGILQDPKIVKQFFANLQAVGSTKYEHSIRADTVDRGVQGPCIRGPLSWGKLDPGLRGSMGHQREGREKDDPCCKEAFGQAACYIYRAIISRYIYQRRIPLITD